MKEIKDIINAFDLAIIQGRQTALATVVHVEGSSYRRPGARMLITDDGQLTGAISGGCLEGDALRKALLVMSRQQSMLVTYDTMDEDDAKFGVGLGCNGIIQVLIEPIDPNAKDHPIIFLKEIVSRRQKAVLITLFSLQHKREQQAGTCLLLKQDGVIKGDTPFLKEQLLTDAKELLTGTHSSFKNYVSGNQDLTAFIELVQPPVSLIIIGAGNDVIPLVEMADILGWETTVIDGRTAYAKKERFAPGCQVLLAKPEHVMEKIAINDLTVFVLMTHNYNYDMAVLQELLKTDTIYAGMLGPRKKLERMLNEIQETGTKLSTKQLSVIYSPVGLDIGAETSEEIALSILAEIKAVLTKRNGQFLRINADSIHPRVETRIEKIFLSVSSDKKE